MYDFLGAAFISELRERFSIAALPAKRRAEIVPALYEFERFGLLLSRTTQGFITFRSRWHFRKPFELHDFVMELSLNQVWFAHYLYFMNSFDLSSN